MDKRVLARAGRYADEKAFHFTKGDSDAILFNISPTGLTLNPGTDDRVFHPIVISWVKNTSMWDFYRRQIAILSTLGLMKLSLEDDPTGQSLAPLKDKVAHKAFHNTGFLFYRYAPDDKVLYFRHKDHPEYVFFHEKDSHRPSCRISNRAV